MNLRLEDSTAEQVWDFVGNSFIAPVIVLIIVVAIALLARWIWRRFVRRLTSTFTQSAVTRYLSADKDSPRDRDMAIARYQARAAAISSMLTSVGTFVIGTVALLFGLSAMGVNIAPLLASAGIAGIAIGFGAQTIVRDFLSGVFMILENQYGVGDVVMVNGVVGTVEDVGLRITTVRDFDGTIWYVTNGSVTELGNQSQGWSVAVVDIPVAHGADLERAKQVLTATVAALQHDTAWENKIMPDDPIIGVESIAALSVTIRIRLHTVHEQQVVVARELRARSVKALESAGLSMPLPGSYGATGDAHPPGT